MSWAQGLDMATEFWPMVLLLFDSEVAGAEAFAAVDVVVAAEGRELAADSHDASIFASIELLVLEF